MRLHLKKSVCLLIFIIIGIVFEVPVAAGYKKLSFPYTGNSVEKSSVGGTVITRTSKTYICYSLAVTKNGKTRTFSTTSNGDIISNERTAYFCELKSGKWYLCKADLEKGSVKRIKVLAAKKHHIFLIGLYNKKLYYVQDSPQGVFCSVNIKNGDIVKLKDGMTPNKQIGRYFILDNGSGAGFSYLGVYDAKTGKFSTVSTNPYRWITSSKCLYYIEGLTIKDTLSQMIGGVLRPNNVCVKRYSFSSKKKKTLVKKITISDMRFEFTAKSLKYYDKNGKMREVIWTKSNSSSNQKNPSTAKVGTPSLKYVALAGPSASRIEWNTVSGATAYQVYYRVNGGPYKWLKTTTSNAVIHKGLQGGSTYYYRVCALNGDKKSNYSSSLPLLTLSLARPSVSASVDGINVVLRWNTITNASGYGIFSETSNGYKRIKSTDKLSYKLTGLKPDKRYAFIVRPYRVSNGKRFYGTAESVAVRTGDAS